MKTDAIVTASFLRRLTCVTAPLLLGALSLGCTVASQDETVEENVGEAADALLASWFVESHGSTFDLTGEDLGVSPSNSTCFLAGVRGNLNAGESYSGSVRSEASVFPGSGGNYRIQAHGGSQFNINTGLVDIINNPVKVNAVCVPYPRSASKWWTSTHTVVAAPERIAGLSSTRRCFLSGIKTGNWTTVTYARVLEYTTTDLTHPVTGWYVESNAMNTAHGAHTDIMAECVDFPTAPSITPAVFHAVPGGGGLNLNIGAATGVKACGITLLYGAFQNSISDGITFSQPATQTGQWSLLISDGKLGGGECFQ